LTLTGIAYMEALVRPLEWSEWPDASRPVFQAFRSPAGEALVLRDNAFVEQVLPGAVLRKLWPEELDEYRRPYLRGGEDRRPTLSWLRQLPIDNEPPAVIQEVEMYSEKLSQSEFPKLFINAEPGGILIGEARDFCRKWKNQREITVPGIHFIQEDSPHEIGQALNTWISELLR